MDQVHVVRHKVLVEGQQIRRVGRELGVSRNTVKRYLALPEPTRVEAKAREKPVRGRVLPRLLAMLEASRDWTSKKQQLTAQRAHELLLGEGITVGATTVKEVVAEWKRCKREAFVPLEYAPGDLAEVDFFEVVVDIEVREAVTGEVAMQRRKAWMFVLRLMFSGRDFAWIYERQDQVSFLEGHARAFAHLGGVPHRIAYDNLKSAVRKVLVGSERELSERFAALCSHSLFEACFCRPATGHDKGGVESRGQKIRWQHLVPIPRGADVDAISAELMARLDARMDVVKKRRDDEESPTIRGRFAIEQPRMLPCPAVPFVARKAMPVEASRSALVKLEGATYSVPCTWKELSLTAHVGPRTVEIVGPNGRATHDRKRSGERSIDYRHFIPELAKKPQAVRQVAGTLLTQLGAPFDRAWRLLVDAHGPKQAARIFAKVLGHLELQGFDVVAPKIEEALSTSTPLLLALATTPSTTSDLSADAVPARLAAIAIECAKASDFDAHFATTGGSSKTETISPTAENRLDRSGCNQGHTAPGPPVAREQAACRSTQLTRRAYLRDEKTTGSGKPRGDR